MSSFRTHALIGGVCGLPVAALLDEPVSLHRVTWKGLVIVGLSALLALWPDCDEPQSWMSQRIKFLVTLGVGFAGIALVLLFAKVRYGDISWTIFETRPWLLLLAAAAGFSGYIFLGPNIGRLTLRTIRRVAGGHRRLTHSLVLASCLVLLGLILQRIFPFVSLVFYGLAYGIAVHNLGDVVTPRGVPLFYPISRRSFRVAKPIRRHGEVFAAALAIGAGFAMLFLIGA